MSNRKTAAAENPAKPITRPTPRTPLERAKRIADDREGMYEDWKWNSAVAARFQAADDRAVIAMWEGGKNEKGELLSRFERQALVERWCQLFGFLPPFDSAPATS